MQRVVLVGSLGRLEKNAPTSFPVGPNVTDQVKSHAPRRADASIRVDGAASPVGFPDPKNFSALQARFALAGYELSVVAKSGRCYFEVRRLDECYTVGSEADVRGLLTRLVDAQCTADTIPVSEWERAFPGQRVHRGMPNHMRRAMHFSRAFVHAAEAGDYVLAAQLMYAAHRAVAKAQEATS